MTSSSTSLIFGVREEAWPKGHGYLYFRRTKTSNCEWLCDLDLYQTKPDELRALFRAVLEDVVRRMKCSSTDVSALCVETENMSSLARTALILEVADQCARHMVARA